MKDNEGRVVNSKTLKKEVARPSITGVRNPWRDSLFSSGLTPAQLATYLSSAEEGDITDYIQLCDEIEDRDAHYYSCLQTRKLAVIGLDNTLDAVSDNSRDVEIRDTIKERVIEQDVFRVLMFDSLDALGKGFSAVEIIWDTKNGWYPKEYKWRDQRFFSFDQDTGETLLLSDLENPNGIELPAYKFVTHFPRLRSGIAIRGGLARRVLALHLYKAYVLMDWMSLAEIYGIPIRIGRYGADATEEDINVIKTAVQNLGSDAGAAIPDNMDLEILTTQAGAGNIHDVLAGWLNKEISKAVLGQTMTVEDGSSLAQAAVHDGVRKDLRDADALQLAATIQRDLINPIVRLNFGENVEPPRFKFITQEKENLKEFTESFLPWVQSGITVESSVIRDKWGIDEPGKGDIIGAKAQPVEDTNEEDEPENNSIEKNAIDDTDTIDEIVDEHMADWIELSRSTVEPVIEALSKATSKEDLVKRLEQVETENKKLKDDLSLASLKGYGLGDARDEP